MAARFSLADFSYAHRGLWEDTGIVENTLPAFSAAASKRLGIEFDVRLSADGELVIFHDKDLQRLAGRPEYIEALASRDIQQVTLHHGNRIPTFAELLDFWPHDLPLLTEMKVDGQTRPETLASTTGAALTAYPGAAAAMSFSEAAVRALPDGLMKGQLVDSTKNIGDEAFRCILDRAVADGIDYVSVHISNVSDARAYLPASFPLVTWTVRAENELLEAVRAKAAIIFEQLSPALVTSHALP